MLQRGLLLTTGALVLIAGAPAVAGAAVPVSGTTYSPRNGEELVEAAKLVTALPPGDRYTPLRIELTSTTYTVAEPVVIASKRPVQVSAPAGGRALITNGTNAPGNLIDLRGISAGARSSLAHVDVELRGTSATSLTAALIRGFTEVTDVNVTTPPTAPAATALTMTGETTLADATITSGATTKPALALGSDTLAGDLSVQGGNPTVRMAQQSEPVFSSRTSLTTSRIVGGSSTRHLVEVTPLVGGQTFEITNSELRAGPTTTTLVDVTGPTGPSAPFDDAFGFYLSGVTALGGPAKASAATFHAGVAGSVSRIGISGLLQLGAPTAIACDNAGGEPYSVRINGIYREGALVGSPTGCAFDETERRTADPKFRDRAAGDLEPLLGSSLIDASEGVSGRDLNGNPRARDLDCCRAIPLRGDIGAIEYQYSPPELDEVWIAEPGNRGLVQLHAAAHDTSPEEDAAYGVTYRWTFSDGATATGETVEHRFTLPPGVAFEDFYPSVALFVDDASGASTYRSIELDPWIALCEPQTDDPGYTRGELCPSEPDVGGGDGTPYVGSAKPTPRPRPTALPTPAPTSTPRPAATPKPPLPFIQQFELDRSKAKAGAKRPTGIGSAKPVEAFVRLRLSAPGTLAVAVAKRAGGGRFRAIPKATTTFDVPTGIQFLHIGPRVGKARLNPGVYRFTLGLTPKASGPTTTSTVLVRITR